MPAGQDPGDVVGGVDVTNIVGEWTLKNAFLKSVKFGDSLDYSSENLVEVAVSITYDYAVYEPVVQPYGA